MLGKVDEHMSHLHWQIHGRHIWLWPVAPEPHPGWFQSQSGWCVHCLQGRKRVYLSNKHNARTNSPLQPPGSLQTWWSFFSMIKLKWTTAERSICLTCKTQRFPEKTALIQVWGGIAGTVARSLLLGRRARSNGEPAGCYFIFIHDCEAGIAWIQVPLVYISALDVIKINNTL